MSASNGQRARFHRNRKKKILMRMKLREVLKALKDPVIEAAVKPAKRDGGPALDAK